MKSVGRVILYFLAAALAFFTATVQAGTISVVSGTNTYNCTYNNVSMNANGVVSLDVDSTCFSNVAPPTQGATFYATPSPLAFGTVALNTQTSQTVTITNTGLATMNITNITIGTGDFSISGGTCMGFPKALAASTNCTVVVAYTPTTATTASNAITVASDASNAVSGTNMVSVSGTGQSSTAPSGGSLCSGVSNTVLPLDWPMGISQDYSFAPYESLSYPVVIPSTSSGGRFSIPYTSGGTEGISVSTQMCDFTQTTYNTGCMTAGMQPSLSFGLPGSAERCILQPGVQYYVNIRAIVVNRTPVFPVQDSCTLTKCAGRLNYMY